MAYRLSLGSLGACIAVMVLMSCEKRSAPNNSATGVRGSAETIDVPSMIRAEEHAAERNADRTCAQQVSVYQGSLPIKATDYVHTVAQGDDFVEAPVAGLDRVITKSQRITFTLDYPFEKPFDGTITGEITLRRTIDAIRAGMRAMYEGTTEREIPGMANKDVRGPYGRALHVIDDLVIEEISLCADDSLSIFIGS